jgi:hypothetical protein
MALERSLNSTHESHPSFESLEWNGQITSSKFTLHYQYLDQNGTLRLAKGIYEMANFPATYVWSTYETGLNDVYKSYDLLESFSTFSRFQYQDEVFYLTEATKNVNGM